MGATARKSRAVGSKEQQHQNQSDGGAHLPFGSVEGGEVEGCTADAIASAGNLEPRVLTMIRRIFDIRNDDLGLGFPREEMRV